MNYSPKSPTKRSEGVREPLAGGEIAPHALRARTDLSDWVELMEAVEALCPLWPARAADKGGLYRL